jgi:hypothetical protein
LRRNSSNFIMTLGAGVVEEVEAALSALFVGVERSMDVDDPQYMTVAAPATALTNATIVPSRIHLSATWGSMAELSDDVGLVSAC